MKKRFIEHNILGKITIEEPEEKKIFIADEQTDEWDIGDEVELVELDGYGYRWIATKNIKIGEK